MGKAEEYIERGLSFLEEERAFRDYEQAFYWLNAARELDSSEATTILLDMRRKSLGCPYEGPSEGAEEDDGCPASQPLTGIGSTEEFLNDEPLWRQPADFSRCVACGARALMPSDAIPGAKYCSPSKGGCGASVLLPIVESGLDRGLALQSYREVLPGRQALTRSSLASFVHMLKYDSRMDDALRMDVVREIAGRIAACGVIDQLAGESSGGDLVVVPAPSSKNRKVQPVHLLAKTLSADRFVFQDVLRKKTRTESKGRPRGAELAVDEIACGVGVAGKAVLLVDDTYGEGATLRACIRALRAGGAREVYFLSLCKNLYGGVKGSSPEDGC